MTSDTIDINRDTAHELETDKGFSRLTIAFVVAALLSVGINMVIRNADLPIWASVLLGLVPLAGIALLGFWFLRLLRSFDELQKQLHIRAAATTALLPMALIVLAGNWSTLGFLGPEDANMIWPLLLVTYLGAYHIGRRKYE